jgi:alkanesulfonate monooxygenase SsuD/methylene tetrahydromethanopterin reductase-like flavin-dependent oxidoreductase (luciferase family)
MGVHIIVCRTEQEARRAADELTQHLDEKTIAAQQVLVNLRPLLLLRKKVAELIFRGLETA